MLRSNLNSIKGVLLAGILSFTFNSLLAYPAGEDNTDPIYVKASATGNNDGSSWEDAFTNLHDAISLAREGDRTRIVVAKGTYYTTSGSDRSKSFDLSNTTGLQLLGGFNGDEEDPSNRNNNFWQTHQTILSGEIGDPQTKEDNSYHVVNAEKAKSLNIDGFYIEDGYADGPGNLRHGAGMIITNGSNAGGTSVRKCHFRNNHAANGDGGAIYLEKVFCNVENSFFTHNVSRGDGGAICYKGKGNASIRSSYFRFNSSTQEEGGAIAAFGEGITLSFCELYQNVAKNGASVYQGKNNFLFVEYSTFVKNGTADIATNSVRTRGEAVIRNSIFWNDSKNPPSIFNDGDLSLTYSIVQGGFSGAGNLDLDPLFIDEDSGNFRLTACSPAIGAAGQGLTRDIGAYPFFGTPADSVCPGSILYVDQTATGSENGLSWENAFTDIQQALIQANSSDEVLEIWVAAGTYTPTSGTDRSISFSLADGVDLLGGFNGSESSKEERDPVANPTYLSGQINGLGADDNSLHILKAENLLEPTLLDGFSIENGYASGTGIDRHGAGLLVINTKNLAVINCTFHRNMSQNGDGAGIYISNSHDLDFENILFDLNTAQGDGGAIYLDTESYYVSWDRCIFNKNISSTEDGGAIAIFGGVPSRNNRITNSLFTDNESQRGGAIYLAKNGSVEIGNTTFADNSAPSSKGSAVNVRGELVLYNSILWRNSDQNPLVIEENEKEKFVTYSLIEGGFSGEQNINANPQFVNPAAGNYTLSPNSPAIDKGRSVFFPLDLSGQERVNGEGVDLGAYEFQGTIPQEDSILFVDADAAGANDGTSWENAFLDLQDALTKARNSGETKEIWVAKGTYTPSDELNPDHFYNLVSGIRYYGGFSGDENELAQRNWQSNPTVLSGFLGVDQTTGDSIHAANIVKGVNLNDQTIFDGFILEKAISSGYIFDDQRGAMYLTHTDSAISSSPLIKNCKFQFNRSSHVWGVGLRVVNSTPRIDNCTFQHNSSEAFGAGIYMVGDGDVRITNSTFSHNFTDDTGGGIFFDMDHLEVENCVFYRNHGGEYGGGAIYALFDKRLTVRNSTFIQNSVVGEQDGSAIFFDGITNIYNSIFWGNTYRFSKNDDNRAISTYSGDKNLTLRHCLLQGEWPESVMYNQGNFRSNPRLVDEENGDLRLSVYSPAINKGLNSESTLNKDIDGNTRILEGTIDVGAYEFQGVDCQNYSRMYVDLDATGLNDGSSWENAFSNLNEALGVAKYCETVKEVWVAEGTYFTTDDEDEDIFFELRSGVSIYGGFNGTESFLDQRDWTKYESVLSGVLNDSMDNHGTISRNILVGDNLTSENVIDGLVFRRRYNGCSGGPGLLLTKTDSSLSSTPYILNCRFERNYNWGGDGAAMALYDVVPTIDNCTFFGNFAEYDGGAIYAEGNDSLWITNSTFWGNSVYFYGGAITSRLPYLEVSNCVFFNNYAEIDGGGAIRISSKGDLVVRNCTFADNDVDEGYGAALYVSGKTFVSNSIFWNNGDQGEENPDEDQPDPPFFGNLDELVVTHSLYQEGWPGEGNIDADPVFADETGGDLRLLFESPAINAGINSEVILPGDRDGNPRIVEDRVDMGAYEFQGEKQARVIRFWLVDAETDTRVKEVTWQTLDFDETIEINIEAETVGEVGSVKFELEGPLSLTRTENRSPWALFGDRDGDFRPFTLYPGRYTLKATPYRLAGAVGEAEPSKEISFRIVGADPSFRDDPFTVQVFPNPSNGIASLSLPTDWYEDTDLQLTDMMGSTIWQTTLSEGQRREELNFSHLAEGVYLLQAQNGEHMETSRIVIAH